MFPQFYQEITPPSGLAEFVECFWQVKGTMPLATAGDRILPNGCIDIIFNLADLPQKVEGSYPRLRSFVVGQMRKPVTVWQGSKVDLLGIRFRLGGSGAFLRVKAADLNNCVLPLSDLLGDAVLNLETQLAGASFERRVGLLTTWLQPERDHPSRGAQSIEQASLLIEKSCGLITVDALCAQLDITPRHIERLFVQHVGLNPKLACRIVRFSHAVERLRHRPNVAWAEFSLRCGYYDQAHFIRDFREFAGMTPGEYRAQLKNVAFVQ